MKATIALNQIDKIEIYQNTKRYYKEKIKAITGCNYILNGAFFSRDYKPLQTLKVNGYPVAKDPIYDNIKQQGYYGYGWDSIDNIQLTRDYNKFKNFICCMNGLKDGVSQRMYYNPDVAGYRARSAIGLTKDSLVLYCDKANKTPEQVRDIMKSMGCQSMICLDGGGSTQGNFDGVRVDSSENYGNGRICYSYILVYLKKSTNATPSTNNCPYTEPTILIRYGSKGEGAKWVQWYLNKFGNKLTVDGQFGLKSVVALKSFQSSHGLVSDGLCGTATRKALKS